MNTRPITVLAFFVSATLLILAAPGVVKSAAAHLDRPSPSTEPRELRNTSPTGKKAVNQALSTVVESSSLGQANGLSSDDDWKSTKESGASNAPAAPSSCVIALPEGMCAYYGDLHSHTSYSDGQATPEIAYQTAITNGLDFLATTDHGLLLDETEWNDTLAQAQAATVEDQFVALRAFEWTSLYGHVNVFNTGGLVRASNPDYNDLEEFYDWLSDPAQINAVAQFNHPYYPPDSFANLQYEQLVDRHVQLIEVHDGDSMRVGKYKAALEAGWHVGPANNSDTHRANWGERKGRTGIIAPALTYHHVINALRHRRVFATQDENMILAMRANGYWMGSVIPGGPVQFEIYAFDPDPADSFVSLQFYQNGEPFTSTALNPGTSVWRFSLPALPRPGTWWYVKATQKDGHIAFTSPIWTRRPRQFDALIRDNMWDVGDVPSNDPSWQSPDIWVRHSADGQLWHENPVAGETNQVYARIQNIGSEPLTNVDVYFYWASPAVGLTWPDGWNAVNSTPIRIPSLYPGQTLTVRTPWQVPNFIPKRACLLARLVSAQDPIQYEGHPKWDNNIGWKNIHIVDMASEPPPSGVLRLHELVLHLKNPYDEEKGADIHFSSGEFPPQGSLVLYLESQLFDRWMATELGGSVKGAVIDPVAKAISVTSPLDAVVYGLPLEAEESSIATLALEAPTTSALSVQVSEHIDGEDVGGNLYTTPFSRAPAKIDLQAAVDTILISRTVELTAVVVGEGFIPVSDGTEVHFSSTLGNISNPTVQTENGWAKVTLNTGTSAGTAIVQASVSGVVSATTGVKVYRTCWARLNDDPTDYITVQAAVDASLHPTDVVKVAGHCDTINNRDNLAQVVYLNKALTVRGGYTITNWTTPDPLVNPTTLDAQGQGRVIYVDGDAANNTVAIGPKIESLRITGGDAEGLGGGPLGADAGGGVHVTNAAVTLEGNSVVDNTADQGGGLFLSSSDVNLINNIVADNHALSKGSGLYIDGSVSRMPHNTFAHNGSTLASAPRSAEAHAANDMGDGSGIYVTGSEPGYSSVTLTNTILVSHEVGLAVTAGNTAALEATLWGTATWANVTDWTGDGTISIGDINVWGDPAFSYRAGSRVQDEQLIGSGVEDYHIGVDSAALDIGVDAGVTDDIDGDARSDGRPDLGADELPTALAVTKHANPDPVLAGKQLSYTIQVTNTGFKDLHTTITDVLPVHIMPGETADGTLIWPGGTLTWTPVVTAPGGTWAQTVAVTIEQDYAGSLTNVVHVSSEEGATGVYTETSKAVIIRTAYLPFTTRHNPASFCAPRSVARLATGPEPRQVALDVAGQRVFVAHADGVTVIDTENLSLITTIRTITGAHGIAYDPDRDRIWVTRNEGDRVVVLDGATYGTLVDLPAGDGPHSVAYNPTNGRVYVTNYFGWTVSVYSAETMAHLMELTDFAEPAHLVVNPITNKVYVANHWVGNHVTVIDGASHSTRRIQTGLIDAYGVAVDTTRNLVYVTAIAHARIAIVDGATDTLRDSVEIKRSNGSRVPLRVVTVNPNMGPEGHLFLVTSSEDGGLDQLLLIPNGWPTLGTPVPLDVPSYPLEGIALDPSTDRVWVTSIASGVVNVVQDGEPVCSTPFSASEELER